MRWLRWPRTLLPLLLLPLLVVACSRISLIYSNLDWLIPWRIDRYLNLDAAQKAWLKPHLQAHLRWHCQIELPWYLDWLQNTQSILEQSQPDAGQLNLQLIALDTALDRIAGEVTPTAIELLQNLDDRQVAKLYAALDKTNRKDQQKFLKPPLSAQISERSERMHKRLRPWLGRLNDAQEQHIDEWASRLGGQNRLWLANRLHWQSQLRAALDTRNSADFAARLARLLQEREAFYTTEYRQAYADSRLALAELLSSVLSSADNQQREHMTQRLNDLRRDLSEQPCLSTLASG